MKHLICLAAVLSLLSCSPSHPSTTTISSPGSGPVQEPGKPEPPKQLGDGYQLSGPYTHSNLSVFLIHKPGVARETVELLTLEEAFKAKTLQVTEKGDGGQVNKLEVENTGDLAVYLQAGDTVKGGKQDRTIGVDFLLPPHSGKKDVDAFCVEPGRWQARAGAPEDGVRGAVVFGSAKAPVASREQKLAVKLAGNQSKVWEEGEKVNKDLFEKSSAGKPATPESLKSTSYVLASEAPAVETKVLEYTDALIKITEGKGDAVGMAFAINGEASTVEFYSGPGLFKKLWPKLLKSAALEAFSKKANQAPARQASAEDIKTLMTQASDGKTTTRDLAQDVKVETIDTARTAIFETRVKGELLHRQVLTK